MWRRAKYPLLESRGHAQPVPAGTAKSTYMSFDVANLEEAVKELRDRGVVFEEYDMPGLKTVDGIAEIQGVKGAWFKDPDGNILALGERT